MALKLRNAVWIFFSRHTQNLPLLLRLPCSCILQIPALVLGLSKCEIPVFCSSLIMLLPAIIELTMADDDVEDDDDEGDNDNGCDNLCFLCGGWQPQEVPVDASKFVSQSILRKF